jgi:hypothetical protein
VRRTLSRRVGRRVALVWASGSRRRRGGGGAKVLDVFYPLTYIAPAGTNPGSIFAAPLEAPERSGHLPASATGLGAEIETTRSWSCPPSNEHASCRIPSNPQLATMTSDSLHARGALSSFARMDLRETSAPLALGAKLSRDSHGETTWTRKNTATISLLGAASGSLDVAIPSFFLNQARNFGAVRAWMTVSELQ